MIDYLNPMELTTAVIAMPETDTFFSKNYFKTTETFLSDDIALNEEHTGNTGIAPYTLQAAQANIISGGNRALSHFHIPMTKEKIIKTVDEFEKIKSNLTYPIISNGGKEERDKFFNDNVLQLQKALKDRAVRKFEYVCIQALTTGAFSLTENEITWSADYRYESNKHKKTLLNTAAWNADTTCDPYEDLIDYLRKVQLQSGRQVKQVIFGTTASKYFRNSKLVKEKSGLLINNNYGQNTPFAQYPIGIGAHPFANIGSIQLLEYSQSFKKDDGSTIEMFDPKTVLFICENPDFIKAVGVHKRFKKDSFDVDYSSVEYLAEINQNEDRTVTMYQLWSKSLPIIKNPDCVFALKVQA